MEPFSYQIGVGEDEERLDKWLSGAIPTLSRSYIQKCIKEGQAFVNGTPCKANYRLRVDDEVAFQIPEAVEPSVEAEDIPLSVLYEDSDVLVVDKPKGMVVHPAPGHYSGTLVNAVLYHCRGQLSGINGVLRPGIVHRIDRDTTGSLIVCKNDAAHRAIAEQLKAHSLNRSYRAIVHGTVKEEEGTVCAPIGRDEKDRKRMAVNEKNGKEAVTHYRVLQRFRDYTYIECRLETGRTHQIRVHMAHIGCPLTGDFLYGTENRTLITRPALHSARLELLHPITGERLSFAAPLPADLAALIPEEDIL